MKNYFIIKISVTALICFTAIGCTKKKCLSCNVPASVNQNGVINFDRLEYCDDAELIYNGNTFSSLNELQLTLTSAGAMECFQFED